MCRIEEGLVRRLVEYYQQHIANTTGNPAPHARHKISELLYQLDEILLVVSRNAGNHRHGCSA